MFSDGYSVIKIKDREIPFRIVYSSRKTLSVRLTEEGSLDIRASARMKEQEILDYLTGEEKWLMKKLRELEERKLELPIVEWKHGARIPIGGKHYILQIEKVPGCVRDEIRLRGESVVVITSGMDPERIREDVVYWLKKACKPLVEVRVEQYALQMGVCYHSIRIKDQKSCWGSCSSKKNLNFNWKLLLMPIEIMDYVIVHELAHLKQMNHSAAFWAIVETRLPDYRKKREWLRKNGSSYLRV